MIRIRILFGLFSAALVFLSCKDEPTPPPSPPPYLSSVALTVEDVGLTDVWLKLAFTDNTQPRNFLLRRDSAIILSGIVSTLDTILSDTTVLPKRTYRYKAYKFDSSTITDSSASVSATTLDSTSHNFTWQIDTLGDGNGSGLYDVTIINDTLAYAVGEIYKRDSVGNFDPLPYNFLTWNGRRWELKRVSYLFRGRVITVPIYGIHALSPTDIWLVSGDAIHGDGETWVGYDIRTLVGYDTLSFRGCWGKNSSDVYFVGWRGSLVHYTNGTWQRMESGTTLPIMDVFGARNRLTRKYEILCVAEAYGAPGASKIFSLEGGSAHEVRTNGLDSWGVEGIWFDPDREYFTVGDRVWRARSPEGNWTVDDRLPTLFSTSICGQRLNDVVVGGAFWLLGHWNGASWRTYFPRTSGSFGSVAIRNNLTFAVGDLGNRAIAVQGRR